MFAVRTYRLLSRVRNEGEAGYTDGQYGHPIKIRGEVRAFLIERCQATPSVAFFPC